METKLERIAQIAKEKPEERFTSLIHLINKETLNQCHKEMNCRKASGVDEVTKAEYEENLEANIVRYADDSIFCFQHEEDAIKFYRSLIERLKKFNLTVAEEKTKIIELKKSENDDDDKGDNSFGFLGFTHYVGKCKDGRKRVMRKTSKKKYKASLLRCKEWMKENRTLTVDTFMKTMKAKIQGHCNYYGITDNSRAVGNFIDECRSFIYKWLNRRSQKKSFNWDKFILFLKMYPLPKARIRVNIFEVGAGGSYYSK